MFRFVASPFPQNLVDDLLAEGMSHRIADNLAVQRRGGSIKQDQSGTATVLFIDSDLTFFLRLVNGIRAIGPDQIDITGN